MNILFVADVSIDRVIGGAERVLYEQCTRLARKGHMAHVLTRMTGEHGQAKAIIDGVTEYRYPVSTAHGPAFLASTLANGGRLFERLAGQFRYDCINFHQPFSAAAVLRSPRSLGIRKVYTCHSLSFEEFISRNPKPAGMPSRLSYHLNIRLRRFIEGRALKRSDAVAALSRFTVEKLVAAHGIPREKIVVIPGGVDCERFTPGGEKDAVRLRLGLPLDKTLFLTIRNLVKRMGIENLISAFHRIAADCPDLVLLVGGAGPLRESLVAMARELGLENRIAFTGFIPDADLADYYRAADLFVLPTLELEGFGLITLEAMASGVPVAGTPVGGTSEILGAFDSGMLFPGTEPGDMAPLLAALYERIHSGRGKWARFAERCRTFVENHYCWEKNISGTEELFAVK